MALDLLEAALLLSRVARPQLRELVDAKMMRLDFERFMRWAWPVQHAERLIWNWHLGAKAEHLQACKAGQIRRLIINEPPRHLKSWTCSVAFPAWWWADDPTAQFFAASADRDVVGRDADAHRELCASPEYQRAFVSPRGKDRRWDFSGGQYGRQQDAKSYYRNTAGGHRISKTMAQASQGLDADCIIIDDPLDARNAFNDKRRLAEHVSDFKTALVTRLNDPKTGIIIVVMQRLHELDLSGVLLAEGGWEHLYLPAEYEGRKVYSILGDYDPRTEHGELLFPERNDQAFLDEKKVDLTARGYAGQYQQRPAPAKGAMVLDDWLQYWTPDTLPSEFAYTIGSWDCTFGKTGRQNDYVVGQTWGVVDGRFYLLAQAREKLTVPGMLDAIREQHGHFPGLLSTVIEEKAAGPNVIKTLKRELQGIEGYDPQGKSKEERLAATLPLWEQRRIFLPDPDACSVDGADFTWVRMVYKPELLGFPGSQHDDQVDATSQALLWMLDNGTDEIDVRVLG
jgi:predicted phage terminase large subunit-like protein